MALRNQPYIPLYVQDFLTDEKLMECSAAATGIYIKIMCIMHKSEEYGTILLKQKDKQNSNQIKNFALKIAKHLPFPEPEIESCLNELIEFDVLQVEGDKLSQKRMIKDNKISDIRSNIGRKGGLKTQKFAKAKVQANSEDEIENENVIKSSSLGNDNSYINDVSKKIADYWEKWINYRIKEFGFYFNSEYSEVESKKELLSLSGNDAENAMKIIDYTIASGYKRFIKPDNLKTNGNKQQSKKRGASLWEALNAAGVPIPTDR